MITMCLIARGAGLPVGSGVGVTPGGGGPGDVPPPPPQAASSNVHVSTGTVSFMLVASERMQWARNAIVPSTGTQTWAPRAQIKPALTFYVMAYGLSSFRRHPFCHSTS